MDIIELESDLEIYELTVDQKASIDEGLKDLSEGKLYSEIEAKAITKQRFDSK